MDILSIKIVPLSRARLGGAFYLVIILFGAFAEGCITNKLIVGGDAATAHTILASSRLWQAGIAGNVPVVPCAIPLLWIECLPPQFACKSLLLLALFSNLIFLMREAASKVFCFCAAHFGKCPAPAGLWS